MSKRLMVGLIVSIALVVLAVGLVGAQEETSEAASTWPSQFFAPYVYAAANPLAYIAETAGVRYLTLAFMLASRDGCEAAWGGGITLDMPTLLLGELEKLRAQGGDVIISFGGAGGTELAQSCPDMESLSAQYRAVVETYNVTRLDFDIEGDEIHDESGSVERRSQALAALQAWAADAGKTVDIAFTLPVLPTGLTEDGLAVLQSAIDNGVEIDLVNIMTMNFGDDFPPDRMGENTIQAAESLFEQLGTLYPDKTEAERREMIGLTPMIGLNDSVPEVFTLDDAAMVLEYAQEVGIRQIAMWSLGRDKACGGNAAMISDRCSGIVQEPLAYSAIFSQFTSSESAASR